MPNLAPSYNRLLIHITRVVPSSGSSVKLPGRLHLLQRCKMRVTLQPLPYKPSVRDV